jgi:hypothetical protein
MMIDKEMKMTEFENNCYGMREEDIREQYINSITASISGLEMVVQSVLSDCQEMLPRDMYCDAIRKQLNIAKFILSEMVEVDKLENI